MNLRDELKNQSEQMKNNYDFVRDLQVKETQFHEPISLSIKKQSRQPMKWTNWTIMIADTNFID